MTDLTTIAEEIISLTEYSLNDLAAIGHPPKKQRLHELSKVYSWDIELTTECRRRVTQWGKWHKVYSSDENLSPITLEDRVVFGRDLSAEEVQWFVSEPFGRPKQIKTNLKISNLCRKNQEGN